MCKEATWLGNETQFVSINRFFFTCFNPFLAPISVDKIIDLFDQANVCNTHDYPLTVQGEVGDLVGEFPLICGGLWYDENGQPIQYKECHKLTAHGFELVSSMFIGTSGRTDDQLWITRYGYGNEDYTEFVSLSGEVTPGPRSCLALKPERSLSGPDRRSFPSHDDWRTTVSGQDWKNLSFGYIGR